MKRVFRILNCFLIIAFLAHTSLSAQRAIFVEETYADQDFDLRNSELPSWEIIPGGPGKDGIPALTDPHFTTAKQDKWLEDDDRVVGVSLNGVAKAYPVRILNYHEVINDDFDGMRVAITYSPLCGSVMVYRTETAGQNWEMAISGLLYNNNALYFDRETESLWSQTMGRAVAGPVAGQSLDLLPATLTSWSEWKTRHDETLLLDDETGYQRNYALDTYAHYGTTDRLMFPLNHSDDRLPVKERVLGVHIDGEYKAYPYPTLAAAADGITADIVNGQPIKIEFVADAQAAYVTDADGIALPSSNMYWFAWAAANPATAIYQPSAEDLPGSMSMSALIK